MKLASLLVALSISISVADARNVKADNYGRNRDVQQVAMKIFGGSKEPEKTEAKPESKPEAKDKKQEKADKKADKADKKAAKAADKADKAAAKTADKAAEKPAEKTEAQAEQKSEPVEKVVEKEVEKKPEVEAAPVTAVTPKPDRPAKPAIPVAHAKSEASSADSSIEMDTALMSVLRDIDKALRDDEGVPQMDNAPQHAAIAAALQTLDVALERAKVNPNRIVLNEAKPKFENGVSAESWDSGDIELSNGSHASLSVLWSKKVNGLVNVSLTGNCGCHPNYAGERVGEWVVVLNGKSTLDSGFDIQSQSNVNFWLGKLNSFNVDATNCSEEISSGGEHSVNLKQAKALTLKAVTTESRRKHALAEAANPAKKSISEDKKQSSDTDKKLAVSMPPAATTEVEHHKTAPTEILNEVHLPSATAHLLLPKRAIAGEYITVAVVDAGGNPEPYVEVNFNEAKANTNGHGTVKFQVPEDAAPGPTLNVTLAGRSEANPEQVYVLQPLMRPSPAEIPRIDRFNFDEAQANIKLEGHNFDGTAENNHVLLDGKDSPAIRFSSPVEIEAHLGSLADGAHTIVLQRNGVSSDPIKWFVKHDDLLSTKAKKKNPS